MSQASTDLNPESSSSSRRGLVAMLLVTVPFSQIPLDTYTPAMPDMVRELATSASLIENTVTVYMLGMALALIPVGMLSDAFGRKKILLSVSHFWF
ncbi:MAG: MFS transporter [Chthoniobacterales bacterium]